MTTILNREQATSRIEKFLSSKPRTYFAMYSSVLGGIVTDHALMMIPIDDHMVHRGDGVFEALKCIDGAIYDADAHLRRLFKSAEGIDLKIALSLNEIKSLMVDTVKASKQKNGTLRIFASRGPGDFSPNPYSTVGSQLYIVYTASAPYAERLYTEGATLGLSKHLAKPRPYCTIKSCNYLPNVMMKKESVDRGLDFVVSTTSTGEITESSTENIALVTKEGYLVAPPFDDMLRGTTLERVLDLVQKNAQSLGLKGVTQKPLHAKDFEDAECALVIGTTMSLIPVKSFEKVQYTSPANLSWLKPLSELLKSDIQNNHERRTLIEF